MKIFINRLFVATAILFSFTTISEAKDYPVYRVVAIDSSDYKNQYSEALNSDPYEDWNRSIFSFNETVDDYFLEPVARFYEASLPAWGRDRVSSFFNNLGEISNFFNSILQGDVESIFRSFTRFSINTTMGIGGLHDVAGGFGLKEKDKSFSQTLAVYGVGTGNFIMVPFIGPSTGRDFTGFMVDKAVNPSSYISDGYASSGVSLTGIINQRANLLDLTDEIEFTSFDPYSTYKSSYLQNKRKSFFETLE